MSYIPVEELREQKGITLAPMIDFLFIMLAVFASLAVSRIATRDTDIDLVKSRSEIPASAEMTRDYKLINISVADDGSYKWVTEVRDHTMNTSSQIATELLRQYNKGLLPEDKLKTQVLLKIDKQARWEPILQVLLAIREAGFEVRPVYEPEA